MAACKNSNGRCFKHFRPPSPPDMPYPRQTQTIPDRPPASVCRSDENCRSVGLRSEYGLPDGLSDGLSVSHTERAEVVKEFDWGVLPLFGSFDAVEGLLLAFFGCTHSGKHLVLQVCPCRHPLCVVVLWDPTQISQVVRCTSPRYWAPKSTFSSSVRKSVGDLWWYFSQSLTHWL